MLIIDPWAIRFHAVVVFGPGKDLLFKSVLGCCEIHYDYRHHLAYLLNESPPKFERVADGEDFDPHDFTLQKV